MLAPLHVTAEVACLPMVEYPILHFLASAGEALVVVLIDLLSCTNLQ